MLPPSAALDRVGSLVLCLGLPNKAARLRGCVVGLRGGCMLEAFAILLDWKRLPPSLDLGPGEPGRLVSCWKAFSSSASLRGDLRTLPVRGGSLTGDVAAAREGERAGERGIAEALMVDSRLLLPGAIFSVESEPESDDLG